MHRSTLLIGLAVTLVAALPVVAPAAVNVTNAMEIEQLTAEYQRAIRVDDETLDNIARVSRERKIDCGIIVTGLLDAGQGVGETLDAVLQAGCDPFDVIAGAAQAGADSEVIREAALLAQVAPTLIDDALLAGGGVGAGVSGGDAGPTGPQGPGATTTPPSGGGGETSGSPS